VDAVEKESRRVATRTWTTEAAGLPCTIELADDGFWIVAIALSTTSRRNKPTAAILEASGGLVSNPEASKLAAAVEYTLEQNA